MFGLESLDVVIGLVFVYLLLSLICVALNEVIAHFLHLRGKMLQDTIYQLLLTTAKRPDRVDVAKRYGNELLSKTHAVAGYELAEKLYAHPLIAGMKERFSLRALNFIRRKGLVPSYIPSRTFVTVLLDVVRRESLDGAGVMPSIAAVPELGAALETRFGPAGQVLRLLAERAEGSMTKFEKSLEQWFEDSMDRLGAAYKRRVQLVGMSVAILVVVAVNANTITIVRTLSTNSTLRQALVGMATQAVNDSTAHGATAGAPARAGAGTQMNPDSSPLGVTSSVAQDSAVARLTRLTGTLESLGVLGLPIGYPPLSAATERLRERSTWTFASAILTERLPIARKEWLGLLITAFAVSLGAPFWFDVLNKAVSFRSSGTKPEEREEARKKANP